MSNLPINQNIQANNEAVASANQALFAQNQVFVVNLLGSPGAGKTSLLEQVLANLAQDLKIGVIEGDLATAADAKRIAKLGIEVIQINTNGGCHLDAQMIAKVLPNFNLVELDLLIIENVGNLVCPADFNLGENVKGVVLSVAEGDDKPQKYPNTFWQAGFTVINKIDLLPYCNADTAKMQKDIQAINPNNQIFLASCQTGAGLNEFAAWLKQCCQK